MSTDFTTQIKKACAENDIESINVYLASIHEQPVSLDELLNLTQLCLCHLYWPQAIFLFKKALSIKGELVSELTQILKIAALTNQPDVKEALINAAVNAQTDTTPLLAYGLLYRDCELFECAELLFLQLIEHNPREIRALHRLISVYIRMQRYHDALACCQLALEIDPNSLTAHYNQGIANQALNRDTQALKCFMTTVELDPKNQWAHINIAQTLLKQGLFEQGWQQYEWRKAFYEKKFNDLAVVYPEWKGEPLCAKTLLVWADQGLGDIIMFAGFIHRVISLGCSLSIMAEPRLKYLFERSFPITHFYPQVITMEQQACHQIDYQIPFSGLAAQFIRSFDDFCPINSYLNTDQSRSDQFRQDLINNNGEKALIGFSWRGGVVDTKKFTRNIPLEQWRPLLSRGDCQFINLQYDSTPQERNVISEMGGVNIQLDHLQDVDGVASVLKAIDLLVSVDNSTAHLAGAIGLPVWNLLPFSGEWRWFLDSEKSYWYQSMRLIRQQVIGNWEDRLAVIDSALSETAMVR